jgi:HAD superfamily hydrolase (TIGR01509 family)
MSGTRTRIRLIRGRATRRYQAVLCDLFETLVTFDRAGLPEMRVGDRAVPSTVPMLVEILTERWVHPSPETILRMLIEVSDEMQAEKEADLLERSSMLRFARVLERLGAPDGVREVAFVERLVECHMEHLARCTLLPATHAAALERLARGHRLALVSNFDHAPTCLKILDRLDLTRFFEEIVVSDAVGKVKPHAELFEAPLARMGIAPSEALFVGDTPGADVLGAKQAGLDVAWINRKGRELDPDLPEPDLEIRSFAELPDLLI